MSAYSSAEANTKLAVDCTNVFSAELSTSGLPVDNTLTKDKGMERQTSVAIITLHYYEFDRAQGGIVQLTRFIFKKNLQVR